MTFRKKLKKKLKSMSSAIAQGVDLSDILISLGLTLLGIGLYYISPSIMFIVIGTVIFFIGVLGAKKTPIEPEKPKGGE